MTIKDLADRLCEALQRTAGAGGDGAAQWQAVARAAVKELSGLLPPGSSLMEFNLPTGPFLAWTHEADQLADEVLP